VKWWLGLAIAGGGVFLMKWTGKWPTAVFALLAAGACLLAAGSLKAARYVLKRAADLEGFDEDDPSRNEIPSGRLAQMTISIERIPERTALALELALFFSGLAAAAMALPGHAAAAGWAAAAAGLAASRQIKRWPRVAPFVFALAAAPAAAIALLWVPAPGSLPFDRTTMAFLVLTGGACATGASVVMMRWKFSERISLPVAMALAVYGLSWFFVQGEMCLGRENQPLLVAVGVAVGGVIALAGWALRAIDGPAAGVVFFMTSRVYSFVNWHGFVPFLAATVLGWRPLAVKKKTPGARRSMHGAAYELLVGFVPLALAGGYFMSSDLESFVHSYYWVFLTAYAAFCASASAASVSAMIEAKPRARVAAAAGLCIVLPVFVALVPDASSGSRAIAVAAAVSGALLSWAASEALKSMEEWRNLPTPVRRAALGCVGAVIAVTIAAVAGHGASPVAAG